MQLRHEPEVHAVDACNQCGWQEHDCGDGEDFYDLVLLDVNKTQRRIHEKVDLLEQECGVRHQRVQVSQHLLTFL